MFFDTFLLQTFACRTPLKWATPRASLHTRPNIERCLDRWNGWTGAVIGLLAGERRFDASALQPPSGATRHLPPAGGKSALQPHAPYTPRCEEPDIRRRPLSSVTNPREKPHRPGFLTLGTAQRHKSRTKRIIPGICDADYRTNCPTSWCLAGWPTGYPTNRSQTAGKPRPDRDQMTPRSASGPAQSYSSSRAGLISSSGRCLAGRVFGLNGNFSARIFSYAAMSSSCWSVRSMSS